MARLNRKPGVTYPDKAVIDAEEPTRTQQKNSLFKVKKHTAKNMTILKLHIPIIKFRSL